MALPLDRLEGKYEIVAKLRVGGMGAIYKVRHRLLDEIRVVKVLRPQFEADAELKARFVQEARAAIRLRHPNVVQIFDFTVDEAGTAYIVMEFIPGVDLQQLIARHPPPSIPLCLRIARQSLRSLGYLHRHGFVHRDVSPDNLMLSLDVDGNPLVKVIDLGIAKQRGSGLQLTASGAFLGKFMYSSPEHFGSQGSEGIEQRSDLYSFGLVLYELVTGHFPIPGEGTSQMIAGHLFQQPREFSETDPERRVPADLRTLVLKALAKKPDDRFDSAAQMIEALERLQQSHPVTPSTLAEARELTERESNAASTSPPGSTQNRLDVGFGLETTPKPVPTSPADDSSPTIPIATVPDESEAGPSRPVGAQSDAAEHAHSAQLAVLMTGAETLFRLRQFEEARRQVTAILGLDPSHEAASELLRQIDQSSSWRGDALAPERAPEDPDRDEKSFERRLAQIEEMLESEDLSGADQALREAKTLVQGQSKRQTRLATTKGNLENLRQLLAERARALEEIERLIESGDLMKADRAVFQASERFGLTGQLVALRERVDALHHTELESEVEKLVGEARELADAGELSRALETVEKARLVVPAASKLQATLEDAIQAYTQELEVQRRRISIQSGEADILKLIQSQDLDRAQLELDKLVAALGHADAFESLQNIIDEGRRDRIQPLIEQTGVDLDAHRYEAAVVLMEKILELDPDQGWIHSQLGNTRRLLERQRQAKKRERELAAKVATIELLLGDRDAIGAERELSLGEAHFGSSAMLVEQRARLTRLQGELREESEVRSLHQQAQRAHRTGDGFKARLLIARALEIRSDDEECRKFAALLKSTQQSTPTPPRSPASTAPIPARVLQKLAASEEQISKGRTGRAREILDEAIAEYGELETLIKIRQQILGED